jgi:pyruvate/2-oxoglutarate dehydrogenase complex dihydrolipoamide acyltransferase (E2) component
MSVDVCIPKLGMSMTEGKLTEWLVADGAAVKEGTPIYTVETDKSSQEIEAPAAGVLRIVGKVDEVYDVGVIVARIE